MTTTTTTTTTETIITTSTLTTSTAQLQPYFGLFRVYTLIIFATKTGKCFDPGVRVDNFLDRLFESFGHSERSSNPELMKNLDNRELLSNYGRQTHKVLQLKNKVVGLAERASNKKLSKKCNIYHL